MIKMEANNLTSTLINRGLLNALEFADFFIENFERHRFNKNMCFFEKWIEERVTTLCQENNISASKEEIKKTRMYIIAQIVK